MVRDIIGEWDVSIVEKGKAQHAARLSFRLAGGSLQVVDGDPEGDGQVARVEVDGDTFRFEMLAPGSARGVARHLYEVSLLNPATFSGTRRRGMMARVAVTGARINAMPAAAPGGTSLAEAKARAAEAAERASQAAAEAAAALAEVEAATALETARRAAERAASARAAALEVAHTGALELPAGRPPVPPEVLAILPAPSAPPTLASAPQAAPASAAPRAHRIRATHRLTCGDSSLLAVELHPGVFVWGASFPATEQRLREVGWTATPVVTDETVEVGDAQLAQALTVRDSLAS